MRLITNTELPSWYEVNPYVRGGYRRPMGFLDTLRTLFQWHNETLNIYTHLLPGLYFLACLLVKEPECSGHCKYLYYTGYSAATIMGLTSAMGHTLYSSSPWFNQFAWRLDFIGIIAINSMHLFSDTFLVCSLLLNSIELYYGILCIELAWILFVLYRISWGPFQAAQEWGLLVPFLTCVPLTVPLYTYVQLFVGDSQLHAIVQSSLNCTLCILVAGGLFFKGRFPECLYSHPMFDYMPSHVWHHILCVGAVLAAFQMFPLIEYYQTSI
jgi:adiponectin receptor